MTSLLIVTDAWHPQVNGVVRCLSSVADELGGRGFSVEFLTPKGFWQIPLPTYPEIPLALVPTWAVEAEIARTRPDHIHIATEGPVGLMARLYCVGAGLRFTTSYHTRFPEYVAARMPVPPEWSYAYLRWFHSAAATTLVPTRSVADELGRHGFRNLSTWTRGVDASQFSPGPKTWFRDLPGPHLLYVGRVAVEKNVSAFLALPNAGTKIVVGDGPALAELRQAHPEAVFLGRREGTDLTEIYRSADVFVFPSRTDTFGNVMLEALACGTPVAAYPVTGPIDVLTDAESGAVDADLGAAVSRALTLDRGAALRHAEKFTWSRCAALFERALVPARTARPRAA